MKIQWTFVIGLIFAIIVAVFATVNVESVPVNYVFGEASWPLILVILGSVLIGFIISFCFSAFRMLNSKRETKIVKRELENTRVLLNEKDSEILRLKTELRENEAHRLAVEEIPDDYETNKDWTK